MKSCILRKLWLIVFVTITSTAFGQYKPEDFKPLLQLAAAWEIRTNSGLLVEQWERVSDSLMQSKSYRVNGADTIPEEVIELSYSNGRIMFTPTVSGENNGLPIHFTLVSIAGPKYTFENRGHDFPQQIIYTIGRKTLDVTINGNTKNGFREVPFHFTKR